MRCKHCRCTIKEDDKIRTFPLGQVHEECFDDFFKAVFKKIKEKKKKCRKEMKKAKVDNKRKKAKKRATFSFNRFIRKRDEKKGCICCNVPVIFGSRNYHAGHYHPVGSRPDLEFNEDNCFGECARCNTWDSGEAHKNHKNFVIGRIGEKRELKLKQKVYIKKNLEYYKGITKKYNKKYKELCK